MNQQYTEILISDEEATIIPDVCFKHCSVCEGMDHHWLPDCSEEMPDVPVMVCKHCPAVREYTDDDE